jgi:hypothetical protein
MKNIKIFNLILLSTLFLCTACQEDDYKLGQLAAPENVNIAYQIVGADAQNPAGDGSGMVFFTTTGNGAITYKYDFGDGTNSQIAASGKASHLFSLTGLNTYTVTVSAIGPGGLISLKSEQVEVFSSFEDADAVDLLTGGSTKSWYWAADQPGHAGLGPNAEDNGNAEFSFPAWWTIGPFDAEKACMYDDEFVFTKTGNGVTFEQTTGPAFVPATYAGRIGIAGDVCHGDDVATTIYGVKNVSFSPSTSKAAIEGNYRGTTMSISDGGFLGWWVGVSEYDIIEITANQMKVRIKEDETFAWYHTFTDVKP